MKYLSTRGAEEGLTFEYVLFSGYAKDNGLYMPEVIPKVSMEELESWRNLSYPDIMKNVLRKYIHSDEISDSELTEISFQSLSQFTKPEIIPVTKLEDGLNVVELFHGPTLAFKDISMSLLTNLMRYFLKKNHRHTVALVGTAGDTGAAAVSCMADEEEIDLIVLYPKGLISQIQKLQLTSSLYRNVHIYEVEGTSDDLDVPIKQCFSDPEFVCKHNLTCVNSVNWVRVCAQIPHYFYAYFQTTNKGQDMQVIVPTGAGGNVAAGCIAHQMGLPIKLVVAVNSNDIVARSIKSGDFSLKEEVIPSLASAMNIQMPYNIERLMFVLSGYNTRTVNDIMTEFEAKGFAQIPRSLCVAISDVVSDTHIACNEEITRVMKETHRKFEYELCPHTAVGVSYHLKHIANESAVSRAVLATASLLKFPEAALLAGIPAQRAALDKENAADVRAMKRGEDWLAILRSKIVSITCSV